MTTSVNHLREGNIIVSKVDETFTASCLACTESARVWVDTVNIPDTTDQLVTALRRYRRDHVCT